MNTVRNKNRKGFSLVELLIALSVTAMLMAAVAAALRASADNYDANRDIFMAVNPARLAVLRITADIRSAQAVAVSEPSNRCSIVTADGSDITYSYNSSEQILYLITNDDTTDDDYVLCKNITAVTFTRTTVPDDPGSIRDVKVSVTASSGDATETITSGAVVRRNLL